MRILSWNIQWGLGLDGRVDLDRITSDIRKNGDPDVICLQEVTAGFDDLRGNDGSDQFAFFAKAFPSHAAIAAPVLDVAHPRGDRRIFGNMILSRRPVGLVQRHTLPWPTMPARECMPRGLVSATIEAPWGPLRVMTAHLEYSAAELRAPQIEAIRAIHAATCARVAAPPKPGKGTYAPKPEPTSAILLGDFNMPPGEANRARLMAAPDAPGASRFLDAFELANPGTPHPPSMCLFDQADGPSRCLDYAFCTEDLAPRIAAVAYDQESRASDHQAITVDIG